MGKSLRFRTVVSLVFVLILSTPAIAETTLKKTEIKPGLTLHESDDPKNQIFALQISPEKFRLKIFTASGHNQKKSLSARSWAKKMSLLAAINAGMYQQDYLTSVGLLQLPGHVNNPRLGKDKTILAFDAKSSSLPAVQIIDRECQSFSDLKPVYGSLLQGIRMLSCHQKNTWKPGGEKWPIAAIAITKSRDILMIFSRTPTTPYDFTETVLKSPLDIFNLMYLEGGPPAQFFIKNGDYEFEVSGSDINLGNKSKMLLSREIPNVIGVLPK